MRVVQIRYRNSATIVQTCSNTVSSINSAGFCVIQVLALGSQYIHVVQLVCCCLPEHAAKLATLLATFEV